MRMCSHPRCRNKYVAKGYCMKHYAYYHRKHIKNGDFIKDQAVGKICSYSGCGRKCHAKGYCHAHYRRQLQGRNMDEPIKGSYRLCTYFGCNRKHSAKGYCETHYGRMIKDRDMDGMKRYIGCKYKGCTLDHFSKGYCSIHYQRKKRGLPLDQNHIKPIGSKKIKDGYIYVKISRGNWAREHRVVMENYIKCKLNSNETVHHKNGNKADNNIKNLELWSSSQPSGQRVIDKIRWAQKYLKENKKILKYL